MRQNKVPIWIYGHIQSGVIEFFLTDWIQGNTMNSQRIGYVRVSSFDQNPERQEEVAELHTEIARLRAERQGQAGEDVAKTPRHSIR